MGFYFRLAPGVRLRVTSRGVRTSVGPRLARVHFGAGRTGISTGAGPVSYYAELSHRRSPATLAPSAAGAVTPASVSTAAEVKSAEAVRLDAEFRSILTLNQIAFPPARRPMAPPPVPEDFGKLRTARRVEAKRKTSIFNRSERREALRQADSRANADYAEATSAAVEQMYEQQAEFDRWWATLETCDPETVIGTLAAAFEDNEAFAAAVGVRGTEASFVVVVPPPDAVPERRPTTTAAGNLSLKKLSKTDKAAIYKSLICGHILLTVREAFAVVPRLTAARVVAVRISESDRARHIQPLVAAAFDRAALDGVNWQTVDATTAVNDCAEELVIAEKGVARELQTIDLRAQPDLAQVLKSIDLGDFGGETHT